MTRPRHAHGPGSAEPLPPVRPNLAHRIARSFWLALLFVAAVAAGGISTAEAGSITYSIVSPPNPSVGGSIQGTITTDGTIGTITASDITGWNVNVFDSSHALLLTLDNGNSQIKLVTPIGGLTATPTELELPTQPPALGPDSLAFFESQSGPYMVWQFVNPTLATIGSGTNGSINDNSFFLAHSTMTPYVIATAVPEPSSIALGAVGAAALILFGCWHRLDGRRQRWDGRAGPGAGD